MGILDSVNESGPHSEIRMCFEYSAIFKSWAIQTPLIVTQIV